MTKREAARLAVRILAIWAMLDAIGAVHWSWSEVLGAVRAASEGRLVWLVASTLVAATPLVQVAIGVWLWRRAGVVAAWMTGHDLQDEPDEPDPAPRRATADELHAVVLSSIGVWVVVTSVPDILGLASWFFTAAGRTPPDGMDVVAPGLAAQATALLLRLLLGAWLIFGAARLVPVLRKARSIGLDLPPSAGPDDPETTREGPDG